MSHADDGREAPSGFNFTRDVVEHLAADPRLPALTFVDADGVIERQTFAQVAADAARWAHLLRGSGYQPGDRVLALLGNVPESIGVLLGSIKSGLVTVPCPAPMAAGDVAFRARHSGASLLIADRSAEAEVDATRGLLDGELKVLFLDEAQALLKRCRAVAPTEITAADRYPFVLYTSGVTKRPKGVAHTHAATYAARSQAKHWLDAGPGDIVWSTAGNWWGHSIWNVLGPWSLGAEIVMHAGEFDPAERLDLVEFLGVSILGQSPTEYGLMARQDRLESLRPSRLRHAVAAGEPLDPEVMARLHDAFGIRVCDGYGQAEIALLLAGGPARTSQPGSLGLPVPGHHVAVIDEGGRELPPGEEGDIALQGRPPTLFDHYWRAPEETEAAFRGSWYLTGDRATRDEDGSFWFMRHADGVAVSGHRVGAYGLEPGVEEPPPGEVARLQREAAAREAKQVDEARARAAAEQSRQEARGQREAAKDARRAEKEARRAEEARLRGEATEQARLAEAQRRAEQGALQAEAARLRAESDERRRQERAQREAEKRDRQAAQQAQEAEEARVMAEAHERRRQEEARRRAEQEATRAEAPRLRAEAKERARLQEAQRRAEQETRKAEESRVRAEAKERARLGESGRRAEEEARQAARERLRAEEEQRRRSVQEKREAERDRLRLEHERLRAAAEAAQREEADERRQAEEEMRRATAGDDRSRRDEQRRAEDDAARREQKDAERRRQVEATRRKLEQAELKRRRTKPRPPKRTTTGSQPPEDEPELGNTLVERLQAYGHGGGSVDDA